jgi:pyruvate kinase
MRRHRNAKIVATLGPASASEDIIRSLFLAGVDVFRLNFSHGSHEAHRERLQQIRNVERSVGRPIGVLADMQGPKLRNKKGGLSNIVEKAMGSIVKSGSSPISGVLAPGEKSGRRA